MDILQCECGSYLIMLDVSTGNMVCKDCNSNNVRYVNDLGFIKKQIRLDKKIKIFGDLDDNS
jgi:Zn finger protein HypA/HybF involved in hydrogenase expression